MRSYNLCRVVLVLLWFGGCDCQTSCVTCRTRRRRRRLLSFQEIFRTSGEKVTLEQHDEIKGIMERAENQVEIVTQFADINRLLSGQHIGLKAVSEVADSLSLSLLGLLRDLVETLEAIPIVGAGASAIISVLEAVDDVFYDVLDVVLVFLRDDLIGGLVGADASVSSDARAVGLVNADGFLNFFPPVERFVEGVEDAIGILDDIVSDPVAAQQSEKNATAPSLESIAPVLAPLAVLESIVSDTLTDISCLLDGEGGNTMCGERNSTQRCNIDRLICSAQSLFFGEKQNATETVIAATNGTEASVEVASNNTTAGSSGTESNTTGIDRMQLVQSNDTSTEQIGNTNETVAIEAAIDATITEALEVGNMTASIEETTQVVVNATEP